MEPPELYPYPSWVDDGKTEPALVRAVGDGCLAAVETLLAADGADVNIRSAVHGGSVLHLAAEKGHVEIVSSLLERGADKEALDFERESPLVRAVQFGHLAVVETLLGAGAEFNKCCRDPSLLHHAAEHGRDSIVSTRLQRGPDVNVLDFGNRTPLMTAAKAGHLAVVEALLAAGAEVNGRDLWGASSALHLAARHGHSSIASALLRKGAHKDERDDFGDTPLLRAASEGHLGVVETLLAAGADVHIRKVVDPEASYSDGRLALHLAAGGGHGSVASALLRNGAEKDALDDRGISPLMSAAMRGHLPVVEVLLAAGADLSIRRRESGSAAIHFAASGGHGEVLSLLLQKGADKDARDYDGVTPLRCAAFNGHLAAVEVLLEAGANMEARHVVDRRSPLEAAVWKGHIRVLEAFLSHGVDVNAHNPNGRGALHIAGMLNRDEAVHLLIGAGADIESKTDIDSTPLLEASSSANYDSFACEAMLALLRRGANVNARAIDGRTPLYWVCEESDQWVHNGRLREAVGLLLRWGADETVPDDEGRTPADMLASRRKKLVRDGAPRRLLGEMERVRSLLARAPADRAWRRRSWLVLLRARASATRGDGGGGGGGGGAGGGDRSSPAGENEVVRTPEKPKKSRSEEAVRIPDKPKKKKKSEQKIGVKLEGVVTALLGLDEGVFRTVVGFV